jgi:O-succinylbenzoic acid--CoA ligase
MAPRTFHINGIHYSTDQLVVSCNNKVTSGLGWEKELYAFIRTWISEDGPIAMTTSGSTGAPKEMLFPRSAFVASAMATINFFHLQPGQRLLLCLPAQYVASRLMVVRAFIGDMELVIVEPSGNPLKQLTQPVDFAALVPMQVMAALTENSASFAFVRQIIIGGSQLQQTLEAQLQNITSVCWETYGMTETLTHVAVRAVNTTARSSVFTALPGVVFSVDAQNCLQIDVPRICPQLVSTTDVVRLVDVHHFEWLGRADNVINSGGVKIHPEAVAPKLAPYIDLPFVLLGLPDDKYGQKVILVLEGEGKEYDFKMIYENAGLTKFEKPKQVCFVPSFPRSEAGKVLVRQLKLLLQ